MQFVYIPFTFSCTCFSFSRFSFHPDFRDSLALLLPSDFLGLPGIATFTTPGSFDFPRHAVLLRIPGVDTTFLLVSIDFVPAVVTVP